MIPRYQVHNTIFIAMFKKWKIGRFGKKSAVCDYQTMIKLWIPIWTRRSTCSFTNSVTRFSLDWCCTAYRYWKSTAAPRCSKWYNNQLLLVLIPNEWRPFNVDLLTPHATKGCLCTVQRSAPCRRRALSERETWLLTFQTLVLPTVRGFSPLTSPTVKATAAHLCHSIEIKHRPVSCIVWNYCVKTADSCNVSTQSIE